jgi:hypothetical protein
MFLAMLTTLEAAPAPDWGCLAAAALATRRLERACGCESRVGAISGLGLPFRPIGSADDAANSTSEHKASRDMALGLKTRSEHCELTKSILK